MGSLDWGEEEREGKERISLVASSCRVSNGGGAATIEEAKQYSCGGAS